MHDSNIQNKFYCNLYISDNSMDKSRGSVEKKSNFFSLCVGKEIWVGRGPETKNQLGFP